MTLQIELESLKKETDVFSVERRSQVEEDLLIKRQEADGLTAVWKAGALLCSPQISQLIPFSLERDRLEKIKENKKKLEEAKYRLEVAQRQGQFEVASRLRYSTIPELEKQLPTNKETEEKEESPLAMLHDRVTSNDIARVVAKATGIPVQNLMKGERDKLVHVCNLGLVPLMVANLYRWKKRSETESLVKTMSLLRSVMQSGFLVQVFKRQIDLLRLSYSLGLQALAR